MTRTRIWVAAVLLVVLLVPGLRLLLRNAQSRSRTPPGEIRGEPIQPLAAAAPSNEVAATPGAQKRKHPKPSSFQRRMVEFQVNLAAGSNVAEAQAFSGTPAKTVFSPAQLATLPEPAPPPGCERIGFDKLSSFPFEVTREMAEASNGVAAASAAIRAKIPASVQALDNHLVAIRGFLLPLKMNNGLAIEILLMRNQNMCCFGTVPKINEWIAVSIPGEGTKPTMDQPITVMGRFHVGDLRENGYLVGIYRMEAEKVWWPD